MEDLTDDLLNEHQQRGLSTRLAMLDRFFYDVEQLVSGDSPRGGMFEVVNDLTQEQRERVLSLLDEGRRQLRVSRDQFNLELKREYVHRVMAGHLSIFWTILEGFSCCEAGRLWKRLPALAAELDPRIENLIRIVNSLKSLAVK